jgi:hypothetical protein
MVAKRPERPLHERHVPMVHASVAADKLGRMSPHWMRHTHVTHPIPLSGTNRIKHLAQPTRLGFLLSGFHVTAV